MQRILDLLCFPIVVGFMAWSLLQGEPASEAESFSSMKLYVRCAMLSMALFALAGCQNNKGVHKIGGGIAKTSHVTVRDNSWRQGVFSSDHDIDGEPEQPSWANYDEDKETSHSSIESIRQMASRLAPSGVNVSTLSGMVGKRRKANIGCIPKDLRMILNTVAWHFGKKVHIQSGYRSKYHNRRVGGAKRSYHIRCKAVDIQVSGINKYALARFLKTLPGRGGVGTYCSKSTVHIDVGPKRAWHYGCRRKSRRRFASKRK